MIAEAIASASTPMNCRHCGSLLVEQSSGNICLHVCANTDCGVIVVDGAEVERALERLVGSDGVEFWRLGDGDRRRQLVGFLLLQEDANTFASVWTRFSDDELAELLAPDEDPSPIPLIPLLSLEALSRCFPDRQYTPDEWRGLWEWLSSVLAMSAAEEFNRRTVTNETTTGGIIREWLRLGPNALTGEQRKTLLRKGQWHRHPPDGQEEADASFWVAVSEKVQQAGLRLRDADSLRDLLKVMLAGGLNKVAPQADNVVREQNRQRIAVKKHEVLTPDFGEETAALAFRVTHDTGDRIDDQILLAELFEASVLTDREKQVLELRLTDLTQSEIAEQLAISQPRVAQLLRDATGKLRAHAISPKPE